MRKLILSFLAISLFNFVGYRALAQTSCASPVVISTLPYTASGLNTTNGANVFDTLVACQSSFMGGNEYLFAITPTVDKLVNISLSGTGQNVGLFVINGCATDLTSYCITKAEALVGNPVLNNVQLHADSTYYIIVSSKVTYVFGFPIAGQTTAFGINVTEVNPNDMQMSAILKPNSGCNLSNADTVRVRVKNTGLVEATNVQVAFRLNNGTDVLETIPNPIAVGDSLVYTFTTEYVDLSLPTQYTLKTWVIFSGDGNANNDTLNTTINAIPLIATYPYLQDFEASNGGWYTAATGSSWAWGVPAADTIHNAASGTNAWVTNLTGVNSLGETSYLNSPCIDLSTLVMPVVKLKINRKMTTGQSATLQYSIDGGQSWTTAGVQGSTWYNTANGFNGSSFSQWETKQTKIAAIGGQADVRLRVMFTGSFTTAEGIGVDDIEIFDSPANDVGVVQIVSPTSSCGLGTEAIVVKIANFGSAAQTGFPVGYSIGGAAFVYENVTVTVDPNDTIEYTFAAYNFSTPNTYEISAKTNLTLDAEPLNDLASSTVVNTIAITTFPYAENFENGAAGWIVGGTSPSWELGTPAGTTIIGAASGTNAWKTNLDSLHNSGENSWVISPCINLGTLVEPVVELKINYNTNGTLPIPIGGASTFIDYSLDNGTTWTTLGANGDPINWYNGTTGTGWTGATTGWITAKRRCPELAGETSVKIRVHFDGSLSGLMGPSEGFGFDDVRIYEMPQNDIAVVRLDGPTNNCSMNMENISVSITNLGSQPQSNFPIYYTINGGTSFVMATVSSTINYGDTIFYTFPLATNFSAIQSYNTWIFTALAIDEDKTNDTLHTTIVNSPVVSTFPYLQDFETAGHNWISGGTNSSWEVGVPTNQTITPLTPGNSSYITNASGNHNASENSWVVSPCFNFSTLTNPYIKFNIFYETPSDNPLSSIATTLEASTDGGFSWVAVGLAGDSSNWYNGGSIIPGFGSLGWQGSSNQWLTAIHLLDGTGGLSNVKLRVKFGADASIMPIPIPGGSETSGFAFDNIEIKQCVPPALSFYTAINNRTVTFNNTSTNSTSYTWDFGDGTTDNNTSPSHTYSNDGVYIVKLIGRSECTVDSIQQQVNVGNVGIQSSNENANILCQPNPNDGNFDLVFENVKGQVQISIINALGQTVMNEEVTISGNTRHRISGSSLEKGIYFVQIQSAKFKTIKKIIIR